MITSEQILMRLVKHTLEYGLKNNIEYLVTSNIG